MADPERPAKTVTQLKQTREAHTRRQRWRCTRGRQGQAPLGPPVTGAGVEPLPETGKRLLPPLTGGVTQAQVLQRSRGPDLSEASASPAPDASRVPAEAMRAMKLDMSKVWIFIKAGRRPPVRSVGTSGQPTGRWMNGDDDDDDDGDDDMI